MISLQRFPPGDYGSERYCVVPALATQLLEDVDVIDLGDRQFQDSAHARTFTPIYRAI